MDTWEVKRHSGRDRTEWRVVYSGTSETLARKHYAAIAEKLRQGGVRIYRNGQQLAGEWAPRLRTRW